MLNFGHSIIIFFLLFIVSSAYAQENADTIIPEDSIPIPESIQRVTYDKEKEKKKKVRKKPSQPFFKRVFQPEEHNPLTATAFSLVLPGAGQIYNKKYWKLPIVYGALGGMSYLVYKNTQDHRMVRDAYLIRVDGDPSTIDKYAERYSDAALNTIRLSTKKNQELAAIGLGFAYILVAVDAFVDAHMINFNVDDDLSLGIHPTISSYENSPVFGLSLSLQSKKPPPPHHFFP